MKNWPYEMTICFVNDFKKRVKVRKVFNELFDTADIETIAREEKIESEGYTIHVICDIKAETMDKALKINTRLSENFQSRLKKIFGPDMKGLKSHSGGLHVFLE